jgi:hypothetical protein
LISEVFYYSGTDQLEEWIELYNRSAVTISLSGYKIGDEESRGGREGMYEFPADASLGPHGTLVIAHSAKIFITKYGFRPDFELGETDFNVPNLVSYVAWASGTVSLGNLGDEVLLLDSNDQVADTLSWGDSNWAFEPPCPGVAMEHSLERRPANIDTDSAGDWIDQSLPNPGHVTLQPH